MYVLVAPVKTSGAAHLCVYCVIYPQHRGVLRNICFNLDISGSSKRWFSRVSSLSLPIQTFARMAGRFHLRLIVGLLTVYVSLLVYS